MSGHLFTGIVKSKKRDQRYGFISQEGSTVTRFRQQLGVGRTFCRVSFENEGHRPRSDSSVTLTRVVARSLLLCLVVSISTTADITADGNSSSVEPGRIDEYTDSSPRMETEGSIDEAIGDSEAGRRGWTGSGDIRPILTYLKVKGRDGSEFSDEKVGIRVRAGIIKSLSERFRIGSGIAGRCFSNECDLEFVMESETPGPNGLTGGQITFDELYLHWFQKGEERFDVIAGRMQTRFVLRGGVYFKSLDRNDSNNTRVTWTDGLHATFRADNGWRSNFIVQRNTDEGTGSIRRGSLDFNDSSAKNTFFLGFENIKAWGPVVQRSLDVSYLPRSLLKENDPGGRRVDYWGLVGRLAARWPQRSEGLRFRGGVEIGYAPETPSKAASDFDGTGDVGGFAWNIVASAMDIRPGHSIGINYGRTDAGWLLSPQFLPNSELFEIRYHWRPKRGPLLEARVRLQEDLNKLPTAEQKRREFDFYLRLT